MYKRIILALLVLFVFVPTALGTSITRSNKPNGTTAWVDGDTLNAIPLNGDIDNVVNVVNGGLDNGNIAAAAGIVYSKLTLIGNLLNTDVNASAGIDPSKIDDYSNDDAEQATTTTPGTSDDTTVALTLQDEISMLRHQLEKLTIGTSAKAVASSGGTAALASWIDGPYRGGNLIYHGGFDSINTLADNTNGDGWNADDVGTLAKENLVPAQLQGDGAAINIISDTAAVEGINQVLTQLKASTRYFARVSVKPDVGECRLSTTNADTNELVVTSEDGGGVWEVLAGVFETDATPTAVTINLLAVDNADDCIFEDAGVFEINADPASFPFTTITTSTTTTVADVANANTTVVDLATIDVTPPRPGCIIEVDAFINWEQKVSGNEPTVGCNIDEETVDKTRGIVGFAGSNFSDAHYNVALHYVNVSPTPGTDYTYTVECEDRVGSPIDAKYNCANTGAGTDDGSCHLWVKLTCGM